MTWSYQASFNVAMTAKDQVRLLIGDTVQTDPQLQDEEISQFLSARNSIYGAAADACRSLATKFARSVNQSAGSSKSNFSDMSKAYARMASGFDQKAILAGTGLPYAGGISVADKTNQEQDTDRVKPQFNIGLDDNDILPYGPAGNETEETGSGAP